MSLETYRNPPISEALIDFRLDPLIGIDDIDIENLPKEIIDEYPLIEKQYRIESRGKLHESGEFEADSTKHHNGYFFKNSDLSCVLQLRVDGITVNKLAPYNGWQEFWSTAQPLLEVIRSIRGATRFSRIATRFINKIPVSEGHDIEELMACPPSIPKNGPQTINGMLLRVDIPYEDRICGRVTQMLDSPRQERMSEWTVDIDVYRNGFLGTGDDFAGYFDRFRLIKNQLFEDLLTEQAKEPFK